MLIKSADGRDKDIQALEALAARPDVPHAVKKRIQKELRSIKRGAWGESQAAYAINFDYEKGVNSAIIHDLRIEHDGRVAQIDHVIVNRVLEVIVVESKNFGGGLAVNENGDFTAFYDGKPYAIASPVEQNRRHCDVLNALFKSGEIKIPTRFGGYIMPRTVPVVMLSNESRITIHKSLNETDYNIIKADRFTSWNEKRIGKKGVAGILFGEGPRIVSEETLRDFAERLAALHKPVTFDWEARVGLSVQSKSEEAVESSEVLEAAVGESEHGAG